MALACTLIPPLMAAESSPLDEVFAELKQYDSGKSPVVLEQIRIRMRKSFTDADLRKDLEKSMICLLESADATVDGKQFACKQLGRIGTKDAVPVLAGLLKDEKSARDAVFALQTIRGPEAGAALRSAAEASPARLDIIQALSSRKEGESLPLLAKLAEDTDAKVSGAAVTALGFFADEKAAEALSDLLKKSRQTDLVNHARLRCAQALAEAGKRERHWPLPVRSQG
jgi:HEAT repeat protein